MQAQTTRLDDFSFLRTIWCSKSLFIKFDVSMPTTFLQAVVFQNFLKCSLLIKKYRFLAISIMFLNHFIVLLFGIFWRFYGRLRNPRWRLQDGCRLRTWRNVYVIWSRQFMLQSWNGTFLYTGFVVFSKLRRWNEIPPPPTTSPVPEDQKRSFLNRVKRRLRLT